jgi:hypothetical protein
MSIDRRICLGSVAATLVAPRLSSAASITNGAGRTVTAPLAGGS